MKKRLIICIVCIIFEINISFSAKITDYVHKSDVERANKIFIYKKPKQNVDKNKENKNEEGKSKKEESKNKNETKTNKVVENKPKQIQNSENKILDNKNIENKKVETKNQVQNTQVKNNISNDINKVKNENNTKLNPIPIRDKIEEVEIEYGNVKEISEKLNGFQGYKMIGFNDKIILSGSENGIDEIKKIIKVLDKPKEQIIIKGTIIDTSSNLFEKLGVDWNINSGNTSGNNDNIIAKFLNGELSVSSMLSKGGNLFGIDFNLLRENGDIKIEAMPTLLVMENEEGELKVTEEVLVGEKKMTKNNEEYTEPVFSEAGIVFKILPEIRKINGKKKILLKMDTEISNFKLTSSYNDSTGAKQKNQTKTIITLDNGGSTFIGGLKQSAEKETMRKVPFFSSIPLIGPLFKYKRKNNEIRDIYIEIEAVIQELKK